MASSVVNQGKYPPPQSILLATARRTRGNVTASTAQMASCVGVNNSNWLPHWTSKTPKMKSAAIPTTCRLPLGMIVSRPARRGELQDESSSAENDAPSLETVYPGLTSASLNYAATYQNKIVKSSRKRPSSTERYIEAIRHKRNTFFCSPAAATESSKRNMSDKNEEEEDKENARFHVAPVIVTGSVSPLEEMFSSSSNSTTPERRTPSRTFTMQSEFLCTLPSRTCDSEDFYFLSKPSEESSQQMTRPDPFSWEGSAGPSTSLAVQNQRRSSEVLAIWREDHYLYNPLEKQNTDDSQVVHRVVRRGLMTSETRGNWHCDGINSAGPPETLRSRQLTEM